MSMMSAYCGELRRLADEVQRIKDNNVDWLWMDSSTLAETVHALLDAADTIWELRDDLQRANAENARLREERDMYCDLVDCMVHPDIPDQLAAENAKLRELVQKMMRFFEDGDWCDTCECAKECDEQEQYEDDCLMRGVFHDRMRELGVEVDE